MLALWGGGRGGRFERGLRKVGEKEGGTGGAAPIDLRRRAPAGGFLFGAQKSCFRPLHLRSRL